MRKILFVIPSMRIGGAEKSLVNLLNLIDLNKYDVNLLMFKPEGDLLQQIPLGVHILETEPSLFTHISVIKTYFLINREFARKYFEYLVREFVKFCMAIAQDKRGGLIFIGHYYQSTWASMTSQ